MSTDIIVSYDGTPNDDDALALGKILARTGAALGLAYVRHSREYDPQREQLAQHDADQRLKQGAEWLSDAEVPRHVVLSASTGEGLAQLCAREGASVIVFGSDYRTAPGHVEPGTSAQHLLDGGPVAVAIAPAGLRANPDFAIGSLAVFTDGPQDGAAAQTAEAISKATGASVGRGAEAAPDLIVVGSSPSAPEGRVLISGAMRAELNAARVPVLVVPRGRPALA